ncbi:hypothetical protein DY000_02031138 [Brassica cretica]|nr:hypothetical protein DY000_02031138 [Brassica cretica]
MRPQGPNTNTRVPIRFPDLKENHVFSHDLRVQSRSRKPPGSNYDLRIHQRIFGLLYRPRAPVMIPGSRERPWVPNKTSRSRGTSGSRIRSQDLRENLRAPPRPPGLQTTSGSSSNLRVTRTISGLQESIF